MQGCARAGGAVRAGHSKAVGHCSVPSGTAFVAGFCGDRVRDPFLHDGQLGLGWQESLALLGKLVEVEIPD